MNMTFALMAVHNSAVLPLDEIAEPYLGISHKVARLRAARNELPFPTFRLVDSQKAPLMVRVEDLAAVITSAADTARGQWANAQVPA